MVKVYGILTTQADVIKERLPTLGIKHIENLASYFLETKMNGTSE